MVDYNYNDLWKTYLSKTNKAERQAKSSGVPFVRLYKDKETFIINFKTLHGDFKGEKSANQVINYMVDKQKYTYNKAQGENLVKALKKTGKEISLREARIFGGMSVDEINNLSEKQQNIAKEIKAFYQEQKELYHQLKLQGYSSIQAKELISILYYDSDPKE